MSRAYSEFGVPLGDDPCKANLLKARERAERRERMVTALVAGRMAASEFPWLSVTEEQVPAFIKTADALIAALDARRAEEEEQA